MDLFNLFSQDCQDGLDEGLGTLVVTLDIAGAFDRVWHAGLVKELRVKSIQDNILRCSRTTFKEEPSD